MKLGLVGGAYSVGSKPLSAQECVNLYPEVAEGGGRNKASLMPTPGNTRFATPGFGPIRGAHEMNGQCYLVSGSRLFHVTREGNEIDLGYIGGSGRVSMAHNENAQLIISNGTEGYLYTTSLASIPDFPGGDVVAYLDAYFLTNQPGTRKFYISAAGDGLVWNALDFASKEGDPYNLVTLTENNEDVILFGEHTIEFWRDTGNADFAFEKQTGISQERGCGAKHSVANLDNTVYFIGDDKVVYSLDGYRPVRRSDHGLETFLEDIDVSEATAFTYTSRGHYFYVLNVGGQTWVYDATFSQQSGRSTWHQRRSGTARWRAECYVECYGKHLVGDYSQGILWELTGRTDDGSEIHRIRSVAPLVSEADPVSVSRLELKLKTSNDTYRVWVEISKDGGRTWSDRIIAEADGYPTRVTWRRLGQATDWAFRFSSTDAVDHNWIEAYVEAEVADG